MRRVILLTVLIVTMVFISGICYAHTPQSAPQSATAAPGSAPATSAPAPSPQQNQPAGTGEKAESELKHNIVKYLGYSLFALIVLAVGSGFFKSKKVYRQIHHVLAFTLLGVAILHGILAITL